MFKVIVVVFSYLLTFSCPCAAQEAESEIVRLSGTVNDVLTDEGIENCLVVVGEDSTTTDISGNFEFQLTQDVYIFSMHTSGTDHYGYSTVLYLSKETHLEVPMIPGSVDLKFLKSFFPNDIIVRWEELPIKVFYNRKEAPVRYIFMLEEAIAEWEFVSGLDLFEEVDHRDEAGLDIRYVPFLQHSESMIDLSIDSNSFLHMTISIKTYYPWFIYGTISYAYKAFCHELGHALGLSHSDHGFQIMSSNQETKWEVTAPLGEVIRVVYKLPVGTNLSSYILDED